MPASPFAALRCSPNFRDVAETVPALKPGVLYRSDAIVDPDGADSALLAACGIRLVVDLRSRRERAARPNRWCDAAGIEIAEFDVAHADDPATILQPLLDDPGAAGAHGMMVASYATFSRGVLAMLNQVGARMERDGLPVMIHCTAGKDRTGVSIAFLLLALGIGPELVRADYLASNGRQNRHVIEMTRYMVEAALSRPLTDEGLARMCGVHSDFLDSALAAAEASHGSIDGYLDAAGLDRARRGRLAERMLRG